MLLQLIGPRDGERILDIGTGNGYVALAIARSFPHVDVLGLDIAEKAIQGDVERKISEGIENLEFAVYDGFELPAGLSCDSIISRYAIHHFPDINRFAKAVGRVLRMPGKLVVSDPTPCDGDASSFVDAFMKLKSDGHFRLYSLEDLKDVFIAGGLSFVSNTMTQISFPRNLDDRYPRLLKATEPWLRDLYDVRIAGEEVHITLPVNNALFEKRSCDVS